ncbi:MAG: SDR family oxidoreductase [Woeseiaceae bacterium]
MRAIIVTGSSRGIGAATAIMAAEQGYAVCVNYRSNKDAANKVVATIVENGGQAVPISADVSKQDEVEALFDASEATLGPTCALVNNAGVLELQSQFRDIDAQRFRRVLETNVMGTFFCLQEAIRRMSLSKGGSGGAIVNVSSVAARTGAPNEYVDYAASKAAIDTITAGVAREVAPDGIRVNIVRPGFIYTDLHAAGGEPDRVDRLATGIPLQRGGQPEEVAKAILWLLSDQSRYAVGASLDVTGGV